MGSNFCPTTPKHSLPRIPSVCIQCHLIQLRYTEDIIAYVASIVVCVCVYQSYHCHSFWKVALKLWDCSSCQNLSGMAPNSPGEPPAEWLTCIACLFKFAWLCEKQWTVFKPCNGGRSMSAWECQSLNFAETYAWTWFTLKNIVVNKYKICYL